MSIRSSWLMGSFNYTLGDFLVLVLSFIKIGVLKSPATIYNLIYSWVLLKKKKTTWFCFMYFKVLLLDAKLFRVIMSF